LIFKTYKAIVDGRSNKSLLIQARLFSIMAHALVYVQTNPVKRGTPYSNCKFSFEGYPLTDSSNLSGVDYVVCVVDKLKKTAPWNIFAKLTPDDIKKGLLKTLSLNVVTIIEIQEQFIKTRMGTKRVEIDRTIQTDWKNFSPRLGAFTPVMFEVRQLDTKYDYLDQAYYYSYIVQHLINNHVKDQEFLLRDKQTVPYLVNTCCNVNNNVYIYFLENAGIGESLKSVKKIRNRLRELHSYLSGTRVYFNENTRNPTTQPTDAFDAKTIYMKIIQWTQTKPDILNQFQLTLPVIHKMDNLETRISQLKEHMPITQETFVEMLQQATTLIPDPKTEEDIVPEEDEIVAMLRSPEFNNTIYTMTEEKLSDLTEKSLRKVVMFNRTCKNNKTNLVIPDKIEHYTHMNQILYNKIRSLLFTFPEMIYTEKKSLDEITRKYWNLSEIHVKDVEDSVKAYYIHIISLNHDDTMKRDLSLISLDKYKNLLKCNISNQESLNLLYHYIFISILHDYKSVKNENVDSYLKAVINLFENEDRALNHDTSSIEYDIKLSKKSETQIKTDYLKQLTIDERKSENVLKEHRLDKWGVGLQKSMFKYDKNTYLTDKNSALEVINGLKEAPEVLDEEAVVNDEEGYDIHERAEDDDDAEYEEED